MLTCYSGDIAVNVVKLMLAISEAVSILEKERKLKLDILEYHAHHYQTEYCGFLGKINRFKELLGMHPVPEEAATWVNNLFVPQQFRSDYFAALHHRQMELNLLRKLWQQAGDSRNAGMVYVTINSRQHELVERYLR